MLNYIWAGLIIFSLVFAVGYDVGDLRDDVYRNGKPLPVILKFKAGADPAAKTSDVDVIIEPSVYRNHYGVDATPAPSYSGALVRSEEGAQLRFARDVTLPKPLATVRDQIGVDKELRAEAVDLSPRPDGTTSASLRFPPVQFVKVKAITDAAIELSRFAVTFAIGLIGTLALWLGLMKIAEASGLVAIFVAIVRPVLRPLFPAIPNDHPALGMIAMNLAANVLGLGNAATPFGLKAMEEMQKLNPTDDTATDPMVMLMAINTAGVQLVPSATLVAVMGLSVTQLWVPIVLVTAMSLGISIITCKIFERLPRYRRTNPNLQPMGDAA